MNFARLIGVDLPSSMLRSKAKLRTEKDKVTADLWVKQHGWRYEFDRHYGPTYYDPVTGTSWGLDNATRIQMVRSVEPFLKSRGWNCIGDKLKAWTYADDPVIKGERWTKKSESSLRKALKEEGVAL